jgi:hypothetical protein
MASKNKIEYLILTMLFHIISKRMLVGNKIGKPVILVLNNKENKFISESL